MASPPFDINILIPADADFISQHPTGARSFRDIVESWLLINHNNLGQHSKVELASLADPTAAAGVGVLWQNTGVLKYRVASDAIEMTLEDGKMTLLPTAGVGLVLDRAGAAFNSSVQFKHTGGSVYAGHGAAGVFAVKNLSDLDAAPWFSASATAATFIGTLAVAGALSAASATFTAALPVASGGTGGTSAAAARTALGLGSADILTFAGLITSKLRLPAGTPLTVASGAITVSGAFHTVAGEGGAADNLDTINGGTEGDVVFLSAFSDVNITVRDGTGNISIPGGNYTLDNLTTYLGLRYDGAIWRTLFKNT